MNKSILTLLLSIFILTGLAFSAVPFLSSFNPTEAAKDRAKIRINLLNIERNKVKEIDWQGYKVFIVNNTNNKSAYLMPFWDGAYRLPDPTWERAFVPCEKFEINSSGFSCIDSKLHENWRKSARWDTNGKSKEENTWMPDLQLAPFIIKGNYLVISPEYK